ncbi:MAG: hypothetical protein J1E56_04420 [Ruminococcus sp.]|nr:hypothetical protein [Ruminococcus sp.]
MSKKIVSVILTLMLLISTSAMAAISVSAANGEFYDPQPYSPSADAQKVGLNRYFFLFPNNWKNDYTQSAGIYWWDGTDANSSLDGTSQGVKWPGYKIHQFSTEEVTMYADNNKESGEALVTGTVWYVDVPSDVTTIIFNNALDGGEKTWDNYDQARNEAARQTTNINVEGIYPEDNNPNYPEIELETMNNMIYIIDPSLTGTNEVSGQSTYAGVWYFYHGGDQWDTEANPIYGGVDGPEPGDPTTGATPDPTNGTTPAPQNPAGSSTNDQPTTQPTTAAGNGTIATGSISLAIIVLMISAAATGVVIALRKKELEK